MRHTRAAPSAAETPMWLTFRLPLAALSPHSSQPPKTCNSPASGSHWWFGDVATRPGTVATAALFFWLFCQLELDLIAKNAVNHLVAPLSLAKRGAAQYALSSKPSLLQRPLLSDIADFRGGLYAVDLRVGEQVPHQQPLRLRTIAASSELRRQPDADGPVPCNRPGLNFAPGNSAYAIGAVYHDKGPAAIAEQSR